MVTTTETGTQQAAGQAAATLRLGPRPLPLHLWTALLSSLSALAALPAARTGALPWSPKLTAEAAELTAAMQQAEPLALQGAVAAAAQARMQAMLAGVRAYQQAPVAPPRLQDRPVLWREGGSRLLDYGGDGPVCLVVPSLVNRAYVLDLADDCSLLRWAAGQGLRVLLLDWGEPGEAEQDYDLEAYICGRLGAALTIANDLGGGPVRLVGYCMGGNLALGAATHAPERVAALALLATPWDFHAGLAGQRPLLQAMLPALDSLLAAYGTLPVDVLQALFAGLDPNLAERKFRRFGTMAPESRAARRFVQLEDWLNDGVPLVPGVARECLNGWYGANSPAQGSWRLAGRTVDPGTLARPALVVIPQNDRIVPPASAWPLARALPQAQVLTPRAGHIGMVVGSGARSGLWQPLADWLLAPGAGDATI